MKTADIEDIVFKSAYEFASKITGNSESKIGNPEFDRIFDEAYEALWDILIDDSF